MPGKQTLVEATFGVPMRPAPHDAGAPGSEEHGAVAPGEDREAVPAAAVRGIDQVAPGGGAPGVQRKAAERQGHPQPAPPDAAGSGGPLDRLRAAVKAQDAGDVRSAYGALGAADKVAVARDVLLLTQMVRLLDPRVARSVLAELALPRTTLLQVASGGKPSDAVFLGQVLALAGLSHLTALGTSGGELRPFPAFLVRAVIDPIVNGRGASAMAQLQLASTRAGQQLLQVVYPGQSPIECLTRLRGDLGVVRGGFEATASFRSWLLARPAVLAKAIESTRDGFAWARLLWSSGNAAVLAGWVTAHAAYWGRAIGDGLISGGTAVDGTALRGNPAVASAVFRAVAQVHAAAGLVQILARVHFTLLEQVKALHGAGQLDAASLGLVLHAPGATAADQAALTRDDAVIAMIQPLVAGQRADQVLAVLAGDRAAFCRAVAARNAFSRWVTSDQARLTATMNALPDWGAWIDALRVMNAWELLLRLAGDATLKAHLRAGLIARTAWSWLVTAVPRPVATQPQAAAILDLYGDGSGIALADKYLTWTALYRTPLSRAGHDHVYTWRDGFLDTTTYEKRYVAVDPNDDAMNLFFHSFRQLPRAHIDAASGVVMSNFYRIKSDPLIGSTKFWDDRTGWAQMAAPGQIPVSTSYYMGDNWIVMRAMGTAGTVGATGSTGTPDTGRIGNWSGSGQAVNTPGTDPLSPATAQHMTMFQNHATHEVGHAVGARPLHHGAYHVAGDDWARAYGNWAQNGSPDGYAAMCGWTAAMDRTNYSLRDATATRHITLPGAQIKAFLTGIISGGKASQVGHTLATTFGSVDAALGLLSFHAVLGASLLVKNVFQLAGVSDIPDLSYTLPAGIDPAATKVHFFCTRWGNKWVTYDAACWRNKVSHYGVSSYREMFAEMYVAKFSGAALPAPNNGMSPADFFAALQQADPTELGLPTYGGSKGAPGQGIGGDGQVQTAAASSQQQQPERPNTIGDRMPAEARGIPL